MSDNDEEVAEYPSSEDEKDIVDSFMSNQRRSRQLEEFNVENQHDPKEDLHSEHQTKESLEREVKDQNEQQISKHQNFHKNQTRHEYGQASLDVEPKQDQQKIQNSVDFHQIQLLNSVGNQYSQEPIILTQSHFDRPHQQHDNNEQENIKDTLQQKQFLQENNQQEIADNQRPEIASQTIEVIQHQKHEEQIEQRKPIHEEVASIPQEAHHDQPEQNRIERERIDQVEQIQAIERRQQSIEPQIEAVNHQHEVDLKGQHSAVDNNKSVHPQLQEIPNQSLQSKNELAQQHKNDQQVRHNQSHEVNHNQVHQNQQTHEQKIQDPVQDDYPVSIISFAKANEPQQVQVQTEKNNLIAAQNEVKEHDKVIQAEKISEHQHDNQNQRIIQQPTASLPVEESIKIQQEKIERQVQQKPQEESKSIEKQKKQKELLSNQQEETKPIKKQVQYQSIPQKEQQSVQKVERQPLMPQKSNTVQAINPQKKGQFEELLKEKPKPPARGSIVEKEAGKEEKNCECEIM